MFGMLALMGLVLNSVMAQSLTQLDQNVRTTYKSVRDNYISAKNVYETARQDYVQAINAYKRARNAANLAVAKERAVNFLVNGANRVIRQLEWLKVKVESLQGISEERRTAIINEIDSDINALINIKDDLSDGDVDREEIVSVGRAIKNKWEEVQAAVKRITGHILAAKVNYVINKAERLYEQIRDRAEVLEGEGKNVTRLLTWLDEFETNIETAKENVELGREKFQEITTLAQADSFFREANQRIERANRYVRNAYVRLVRLAKELRRAEYAVNVAGKGWIYAYGNGTAVLQGNGTVMARTNTQGSILVSGDETLITVRGTGSRIDIDNGSTLYEGYGGIRVKGINLNIELNGTDLKLVAYGRGNATLTGNGTYKSGKTGGEWVDWSSTGVNVEVSDE